MSDSTVEKGRITIPDRGITHYLMFNPEEISDEKEIDWGTLKIPGASHPVYQSGAGGDRTISFTVYLDGDRGRNMSPNAQSNIRGLDITREIAFFESLQYPGSLELDNMEAMFPYIVLLTMGPKYQSVPCIVTKVNTKMTDFTAKMAPIRATIDLEFKETVDRVRTAREVYADYDYE